MKKINFFFSVFSVILLLILSMLSCRTFKNPTIPQSSNTPDAAATATAMAQATQTAIAVLPTATQTFIVQQTLTAAAVATAQAALTAQAQATQTAAAGTATQQAVQATQTYGAQQTLTEAATATVQAAQTQTAISGLPPAMQTTVAQQTATAGIRQTQTAVVAAQQTAGAAATQTAIYIAQNGTNTPTPNAVSTALAAMTQTYLATAGATAQAAATATVAAQETVRAQITAVLASPGTNTVTPTPFTYSTPTPFPTVTNPVLPLTIYADLNANDYSDSFQLDCSVSISDANSSIVTNATVTLRDITDSTSANIPWVAGSTNQYSANAPLPFNGGDTYEIDVYEAGVTYTAQTVMIGPAQIDPGGDVVSWPAAGSPYTYVTMEDPSYNEVFYGDITGTSADLAPYYEPGVYGQYQIFADLSSSGTFTGGSQVNGYIYTYYETGWTVDVNAGSSPTVEPTLTPAPTNLVTIEAEFLQTDTAEGVSNQAMAYIYDANYNAITTCTVTLEDLNTTAQWNLPYNPSMYMEDYENDSAVYKPGDTYEFYVCINGVTYTAQEAAPVGTVSLSPDCDTVSWNSNGNVNYVSVEDPSSNQVFYQMDLPGNSVDISPYYTEDGIYTVSAGIFNGYSNGSNPIGDLPSDPAVFAGENAGSMIVVGYETGWDVAVSNVPTPTATVTSTITPTPTITPTITAGGITVYGFVNTTYEEIVLYDSSSNPVTDATVTINSVTIPGMGSGVYYLDTGLSPGAAVNVVITAAEGDASASGTMPTSSTEYDISVTGALSGSWIELSNP